MSEFHVGEIAIAVGWKSWAELEGSEVEVTAGLGMKSKHFPNYGPYSPNFGPCYEVISKDGNKFLPLPTQLRKKTNPQDQ